jgi:serine/threonine-protein kinase
LATVRGAAGFEKSVVLKRIHPRHAEDPNFVSMLIEEAKLSVRLTHQNIVQTLDLGHARGVYFIVMEHIEGYDVHHVLRELRTRGEPLSIDLAAHLVSEVCRGLDHAHRRTDEQGRPLHIVHRDVSPQNVLLSFAGEVKVADFGIAKAAHRANEAQSGVVQGKYFYMSPEQVSGARVDARSDIFSAGVLLWELLTGRALYQATDMPSLLAAVRAADVPAASSLRPGVPPELDFIVATATAAVPGQRYADAASMADALQAFLATRRLGNAPRRIAALLQSVDPPRRHSIEQLAAVPKTPDRSREIETLPGQFSRATQEEPNRRGFGREPCFGDGARALRRARELLADEPIEPQPLDPDPTLPGRKRAPRRRGRWLRKLWPLALLGAVGLGLWLAARG